MAGVMATLSASHALSSAARLRTPATPPARSRSITATVVVKNSEKREEGECGTSGAVSRRQAVSLTALSVFLLSSQKAQARDIPLFGLKKVKKISEEVVQEVKELVKEGESGAEAVGGAVSSAIQNAVAEFPGAALPNIPSVPEVGGLSPALQAGAVAGAEIVAVLVASTVVNGLVSPSK